MISLGIPQPAARHWTSPEPPVACGSDSRCSWRAWLWSGWTGNGKAEPLENPRKNPRKNHNHRKKHRKMMEHRPFISDVPIGLWNKSIKGSIITELIIKQQRFSSHCWHDQSWLVVEPTPLTNMNSTVGMIIPNEKMFQTTNQIHVKKKIKNLVIKPSRNYIQRT